MPAGGVSRSPCGTAFRHRLCPLRIGVKTIFAQPDRAHVHCQRDEVADTLRPGFPDVAKLLEEAKADLLAFCYFPMAH